MLSRSHAEHGNKESHKLVKRNSLPLLTQRHCPDVSCSRTLLRLSFPRSAWECINNRQKVDTNGHYALNKTECRIMDCIKSILPEEVIAACDQIYLVPTQSMGTRNNENRTNKCKVIILYPIFGI